MKLSHFDQSKKKPVKYDTPLNNLIQVRCDQKYSKISSVKCYTCRKLDCHFDLKFRSLASFFFWFDMTSFRVTVLLYYNLRRLGDPLHPRTLISHEQ